MNCSMPGFPVLHYLKFMFIESVMLIISSSVTFSFRLQSFPESGSFPMSQLFTSGGQSTGASGSASVLPMNIHGWFPSMNIHGWFPSAATGLIFLLSKGLFTVPQFESINSSAFSLLHGPTLTSIHDYWRNHKLDNKHLCWQNNVSAL